MPAAKKKPTKRTRPAKAAKTPAYRSFKRSPNPKPFVAFRFTQQTVYWCIIGLLVVAFGLWALSYAIKVNAVYDTINYTTTDSGMIAAPR